MTSRVWVVNLLQAGLPRPFGFKVFISGLSWMTLWERAEWECNGLWLPLRTVCQWGRQSAGGECGSLSLVLEIYIISNILTLQGKRFCFNLEFMPFKHLWEPLTINYQQVAVDDFSFPQKTGVWSLAKMEFESACQRRRFRRCGFDPWVWKISLE